MLVAATVRGKEFVPAKAENKGMINSKSYVTVTVIPLASSGLVLDGPAQALLSGQLTTASILPVDSARFIGEVEFDLDQVRAIVIPEETISIVGEAKIT